MCARIRASVYNPVGQPPIYTYDVRRGVTHSAR